MRGFFGIVGAILEFLAFAGILFIGAACILRVFVWIVTSY